MNSYFASVEQQANPFLRGRSVGVCANLHKTGTIIASSVEAKKKGIKTGCKVWEAERLDPQIVLLESDSHKYRSTTRRIFRILNEYTDTFEAYSIDEAFLDLTGWVKDFDEAEVMAREIQKRILSEVGEWLYSSIGISYTKFLAKFAGDIAPKRSILKIQNDNELINVLRGRDLKDAWGINVRMEARLNALGIYNLLELKNYNKDKIRRAMGRFGYYLWCHTNGVEIDCISQEKKMPKSIGHSFVLIKKTSNRDELKKIFYKLSEKTGRRLRDLDQEAQGVSVSLTYMKDGGVSKSFKTNKKMFTTGEIFSEIEKFIDSIGLILTVRGVAMSVTRLAPVGNQMSFFEDNLSKKELSRSLDDINDKYGEFTVTNGRMFDMENVAKDKIGFRKFTKEY